MWPGDPAPDPALSALGAPLLIWGGLALIVVSAVGMLWSNWRGRR